MNIVEDGYHLALLCQYDKDICIFRNNQLLLNHLGSHQNIIFEDGNAYNNHHGVYFVAVSGLYVFTTSLTSDHNMDYSCLEKYT